MRVRTKKKRRISSAAALREAEGAGPRAQESGRSQLLAGADSAAPGGAGEQAGPPAGDSAAFFRVQRPADWVPGAPLEPRPPVAVDSESEPGLRALPPGPPRPQVPRKRQPGSLQSPLESLGEKNPRVRPNHERGGRRGAPRRAPGSRAAKGRRNRARPSAAAVPAPKARPRPADGAAEVERAPVRGAAPGDSFGAPVRSVRGAVTLK